MTTNRLYALAPARPTFPHYAYQNGCGAAPLPLPAALPVSSAKGVTKNFPETLMEVISSGAYSDVVSWLPHGRGFVVLNKQFFERDVLPLHFDGAKYTSFTRRLKRWSFERVPRGPELGAYYNENFVRDRPELVKKMKYKMDGQLESTGKKKRDRGEISKEEARDEEGEVRKSSSSKVHPKPSDERPRPRLVSQDEFKKREPNVPSSHSPNALISSEPRRDHPIPPLSASSKRRKPAAAAHKKTDCTVGSSFKKNAKDAATIHKSVKRLEDCTAALRTQIFPMRHHPSVAVRTVMMTPKEEKEFAMYLYLKRNGGKGSR